MDTLTEKATAPRGRGNSLPPWWDGEWVITREDRVTGIPMIIAIHSTVPGPALGGTRMRVYPTLADARTDVMRLATSMTRKLAVAGLPFGGGKAVLAVPEPPTGSARRNLFRRYAEFVEEQRGRFYTGIDMNTTPEDMDVMGEVCSYVLCRTQRRGGSGDASPFTAQGVFHGIRAAVERTFGDPDLDGRSVVVQGVGSVGARLAALLATEGARVLVTDIDLARARALAAEIGAELVPADEIFAIEADVFSPCAVGGVLNEASIPRLNVRVVAGAANNQLSESEDAERLRAAGILYAPDYVINAGGVLYGVGLEVLGWSKDKVERRLRGIGDTLAGIFEQADVDGITTAEAAERLAMERLAAAGART